MIQTTDNIFYPANIDYFYHQNTKNHPPQCSTDQIVSCLSWQERFRGSGCCKETSCPPVSADTRIPAESQLLLALTGMSDQLLAALHLFTFPRWLCCHPVLRQERRGRSSVWPQRSSSKWVRGRPLVHWAPKTSPLYQPSLCKKHTSSLNPVESRTINNPSF